MRTLPTTLLALASLFVACVPEETAGECAAASECGEESEVCAGCPALPETLCHDGACEVRGDDAVDVRADVNLDRDLAPSVVSFVHVVASMISGDGPFSCAGAFSSERRVGASVNVLASGYKAVSGGSFHDDVSFGRVPESEVAVLVVATDGQAGEGDVLATGCLEGLTAAGPTLEAGVVEVE